MSGIAMGAKKRKGEHAKGWNFPRFLPFPQYCPDTGHQDERVVEIAEFLKIPHFQTDFVERVSPGQRENREFRYIELALRGTARDVVDHPRTVHRIDFDADERRLCVHNVRPGE